MASWWEDCYDLAVRGDRQRQGIGRRLIAALRAAAAGVEVVFVPAAGDDVHALECYRALGGEPAPVTIFTFFVDAAVQSALPLDAS